MNDEHVPYAPDFTPATLGKTLGEDAVLEWLLRTADNLGTKAELSRAVQANGLTHIEDAKNRRDMASHVIQGLQNYKLVDSSDGDRVGLTNVGRAILDATPEDRPVVFARHILANCNGLRFVEAIQRITLRGDKPSMRLLTPLLDRHATSKNISTMRAWLARAGLFPPKGYELDLGALERLLGEDTSPLFGLSEGEAEFVLAVRLVEEQTGESWVRASAAKTVALQRNPDAAIPHKALSGFVKKLSVEGVCEVGSAGGSGGSGTTVRLIAAGRDFTDGELRNLLAQSQSGFALHKMLTLGEAFRQLESDDIHVCGHAGEMMAVHLCLALGLRVEAWRKRAPEAEIDLIAERTVGLAYQRWMVQVKNTSGSVDSDRIDREVGAAAGTGATHILFVAPRSTLTGPARKEALVRSRLTSLHVYFLDERYFGASIDIVKIVDELKLQARRVAGSKRAEARGRLE